MVIPVTVLFVFVLLPQVLRISVSKLRQKPRIMITNNSIGPVIYVSDSIELF